MNFLICLLPSKNRGQRFRTKIVKKTHENREKLRVGKKPYSPKTHENREKLRVRKKPQSPKLYENSEEQRVRKKPQSPKTHENRKNLPCCSSEFVGILEVLHLRVFGHEKNDTFSFFSFDENVGQMVRSNLISNLFSHLMNLSRLLRNECKGPKNIIQGRWLDLTCFLTCFFTS